MNFPHKSLALELGDEPFSEAAQTAAHRALLAHVIARQSLSYSVRNYIGNRDGQKEILGRLRGQGLDDRMRFFAGQISPEDLEKQQSELFVRGHFRPDIAAQFLAEDSG